VQHGASTLPPEAFSKFPECEAVEIHLATNFQTIVMDHPALASQPERSARGASGERLAQFPPQLFFLVHKSTRYWARTEDEWERKAKQDTEKDKFVL